MSRQPAPSPPPDQPADPGRWLGLAGIGTGVFMFTLDASIVNVALPTLAQAFGASLAAVQWVPLAYLLVITTLVMGAARLGDVYGRKRAYLSGMVLFVAASALCGLAPSVGWLIAFRAVPENQPATLDYFMRDYVDHLEHHLKQILGPEALA